MRSMSTLSTPPPPPLHGRPAGYVRPHHLLQFPVQDLQHDRVAPGLCDRTGGGSRRRPQSARFLTVGAAAPLQEAAVTALELPLDYYEQLTADYTRKRDLFLGYLDEAGLTYTKPQGAYYVMVDCSGSASPTTTNSAAGWPKPWGGGGARFQFLSRTGQPSDPAALFTLTRNPGGNRQAPEKFEIVSCTANPIPMDDKIETIHGSVIQHGRITTTASI
jgi:hypothetical protein